jgi:hypothetical protein
MYELKPINQGEECPTCHSTPVDGHVCDDCKKDGFYSIKEESR